MNVSETKNETKRISVKKPYTLYGHLANERAKSMVIIKTTSDTNSDVNSEATSEIYSDSNFDYENNKRCNYLTSTILFICKNLYLKLTDELLLGGEHNQKISKGFTTPVEFSGDPSDEEKKQAVIDDPKFGMFSLFKYHIQRGYLNNELKKNNKIFCSHIFSFMAGLPLLIFVCQWSLYIALVMYELKRFDGNFCPNKDTTENKLMMFGIGIVYFVRSFFIWDNLTSRLSLHKMSRADSITALLDTFQEFMFTLMVYGANLWIIFAEDNLLDMILNSVAMEFLMQLDNEFEVFYFENLPSAAVDIYDTMYVTFNTNRDLIKIRKKKSCCFKVTSHILFLPYKILILSLFSFPLFCFLVTILGPFCK
jgi:hypothetical protein